MVMLLSSSRVTIENRILPKSVSVRGVLPVSHFSSMAMRRFN